MKKYFLQFYREEYFLYSNDKFINFNNGLSYVWDKIKKEGDLVWRHVDDETLLVEEGIIYASVWYTKNLRLLYNWAKTYPKLDIYICGPVSLHYEYKLGKELSNFHYITDDAEDYFFGGETSKWNLEIPLTDKAIGYSFGLTKGYGCYWGKCRYCKITGKLEYRNVNEVTVIDNPNHKYIWIHTYSLPPNLMKKLYLNFENRTDVSYATYVRGEKEITKALKEILPKISVNPKYLGFDVGIEFPSDDILNYMHKGVTVKDYLEFIQLASENNIRLHLNLIVGWKHTSETDVKSVESFLNNLSKISKPNTITINIYPLTIVSNRKMFEDYTVDELDQFDTDYDNIVIGTPKFNETQKMLNSKIISLYKSYPFLNINDLATDDSKFKFNYGKR